MSVSINGACCKGMTRVHRHPHHLDILQETSLLQFSPTSTACLVQNRSTGSASSDQLAWIDKATRAGMVSSNCCCAILITHLHSANHTQSTIPDIDVCLAGSGSPWSCCPGPVQYAGRTLSWAQGRARLLPACWAQVSRRQSCCLHCPAAQGRASRLLARPFALRYQPPAEQLR